MGGEGGVRSSDEHNESIDLLSAVRQSSEKIAVRVNRAMAASNIFTSSSKQSSLDPIPCLLF